MLVFLTFKELHDSKKGKVREHGVVISREPKWDKVGNHEVNVLGKSTSGAAQYPGHSSCSRFRLEHMIASIFAWFSLSWPKTDYKKAPLRIPKSRQHRDPKQRDREIEGYRRGSSKGETLLERSHVGSTPLRRVHHHHLQKFHLDPPTVIFWQTWCVV
jgi:hypothetical protein